VDKINRLLNKHGVPQEHHAVLRDYYNHMTMRDLYDKHGSPSVSNIRIKYNLPTRPSKIKSDYLKIKRLYDSGMSVSDIGKKLGYHTSTIYKNFPNLTKANQEKIQKRRKMIQRELLIGVPAKEIAQKYKLDPSNVRAIARESGINLARWKEHEDAYIIRHYEDKTAREIAKKLGRTVDAVRKRKEALVKAGVYHQKKR